MGNKEIRTYEIFTEKFSEIVQAEDYPDALEIFYSENGYSQRIIGVWDKAFPDMLSKEQGAEEGDARKADSSNPSPDNNNLSNNKDWREEVEKGLKRIISKVANDVRQKGFGGCSSSWHYAGIWMEENNNLIKSMAQNPLQLLVNQQREEIRELKDTCKSTAKAALHFESEYQKAMAELSSLKEKLANK